MPARRPYASRGVPRRITTRRASRPPLRGIAALAIVVLTIGGAAVWLFDPSAARSSVGLANAGQASGNAAASGQAAFAPLLTNGAASQSNAPDANQGQAAALGPQAGAPTPEA